MSYPINYPTPQKSNFQEFYGGGTTRDWVKPQGASMVRMLLIGAGGGGGGGEDGGANGGGGGGSGAVTQWIGPAMFIPDVLRIQTGVGGAGGAANTTGSNGTSTLVVYQTKDGTGYTLLTANAGVGGIRGGSGGAGSAAGTASANNYFGAAGIYKSVAGQAGSNRSVNITASTTTFLCGGAGGGSSQANGASIAEKYGYPLIAGGIGSSGVNGTDGGNGYFFFQPILISQGGSGGGASINTGGNGGRGALGSGGGGGGGGSNASGGLGGRGGDGAVFIWSW